MIILDLDKARQRGPSQEERRANSDIVLLPGTVFRRNRCNVCGAHFEDVQPSVICMACQAAALEALKQHEDAPNGNLPPWLDRTTGRSETMGVGVRQAVEGDALPTAKPRDDWK